MNTYDKNSDGIDDGKAEKYLSPEHETFDTTNSATHHRSQAGIKHGLGIFLIILGSWWFLQELGVFPDVSLLPVIVVFGGFWLLKTSTKEDRERR